MRFDLLANHHKIRQAVRKVLGVFLHARETGDFRVDKNIARLSNSDPLISQITISGEYASWARVEMKS